MAEPRLLCELLTRPPELTVVWRIYSTPGAVILVPVDPRAKDLAERLSANENPILSRESSCKFGVLRIIETSNGTSDKVTDEVWSPFQLVLFFGDSKSWTFDPGYQAYCLKCPRNRTSRLIDIACCSSRIDGNLSPSPVFGTFEVRPGAAIWSMLTSSTTDSDPKPMYRWPKNLPGRWAPNAQWQQNKRYESAYVVRRTARNRAAARPTPWRLLYATSSQFVATAAASLGLGFDTLVTQEIDFAKAFTPTLDGGEQAEYRITCRCIPQISTIAWIGGLLGSRVHAKRPKARKQNNYARGLPTGVHRGMRLVRRGDAVSVLPHIDFEAPKKPPRDWMFRYIGKIFVDDLTADLDSALVILRPQQVSSTYKAAIEFPTLRTTADEKVRIEGVEVALPNQSTGSIDQEAIDDGTLIELVLIIDSANVKPQTVRDGALELDIGGSQADTLGISSRNGRLRLVLQAEQDQRPVFPWQAARAFDDLVLSYAIEDLRLGVTEVRPANDDVMPGEEYLAAASLGTLIEGVGYRRESPLIIPLPSSASKPLLDNDDDDVPVRYWLVANESINAGQSLRLDFRLEPVTKIAPSSMQARMVVLNSQPQLVSLIESQFLSGTAQTIGATAIARRSPLSDNRNSWELLDSAATSSGFLLWLPAQGIGEDVIKWHENYGSSPVGYRFSPPAALQIAPSRLDQNYVVAPWDLRRVLTQGAPVSPGAPLLSANFELLYGLVAQLKSPVGTTLFITDLGAKVGEIPAPSTSSILWQASTEQIQHFLAARDRYQAIYDAWLSRIMVLEPWQNDPFAPIDLRQGITYRARVKPRENDDDKPPQGAQLAQPWINTYLPDDHPHKKDSASANSAAEFQRWAKYHPKYYPEEVTRNTGLKGGFHYGFESKGIYSELASTWGESSSGEIADLAFSSVGGWGAQTARFCNNKTVVRSVTSMGRTHVYAVERIGRISVFWTKAKHVILYERSTVPSRQFAPYQPLTSGRAFLRKVREYVEILDPNRSYPDFGETDNRLNAGSLKTIEFPKGPVRINVNTCWSHDVYSGSADTPIGWEIPLWRAGEDPEVYPRPIINLGFLTSSDADIPIRHGVIANPNELYFYTSLKETDTDDVYSWDAVRMVDYPILPDPTNWDVPPCGPTGRDSVDWPLPDPLTIHPGWERFTFQLLDSGPIAAGGRDYPKSTLTGRIRNISMTRGAMGLATWNESPKTKNSAMDAWRTALRQLSIEPPLTSKPRRLDSCLLHDIASAGSFAAQMAVENPDQAIAVVKKKVTDWAHQFQDLVKDLPDVSPLVSRHSRFARVVTDRADFKQPVQWVWDEAQASAQTVSSRVLQEVNAAFDRFANHISAFTEQGPALIARIRGDLAALCTELQFVTFSDTQIQVSLSPLIEFLGTAFKKVGGDIADKLSTPFDIALGALDEVAADAGDAATQAKSLLSQILDRLTPVSKWLDEEEKSLQHYFQKSKTWSTACANTISTAKQIVSDATTSVVAIRRAIDESIGAISIRLQNARTSLVAVEQRMLADLANALQTLENAAVKELAAIGTRLDEVLKSLKWNEVSTAICNLVATINKGLDSAGDSVAAVIGYINKQLQSTRRAIKDAVAGVTRELLKSIKAILTDLQALLDELAQEVLFAADPFNFLKSIPDDFWNKLAAADQLADAIGKKDVAAILQASTNLATELNDKFGQAVGQVAQTTQELMNAGFAADQLAIQGDRVLRNARSVFDELKAPGLGFNRKTIAMVLRTDWKNFDQRLGITPLMARTQDLSQSLQGLGLRLPTVYLGDRLLPAIKDEVAEFAQSALSKFDVSSLFSDIGGLQFDKFLPGLKMPEDARDKIKVTHGFDKQKVSAWVKAETNVLISGQNTLLPLGPLEILIDNARFNALASLTADADGRIQKVVRGELLGDWQINLSGIGLIIFRDLQVLYDGGQLHFNLDPAKIESPGLLEILTDATKAYSGGGSDPFQIGIIQQKGIPVGVRAQLDIGPFEVGGGVSGVTGILFGGHLEMRAVDEAFNFNFSIAVGCHFGRRDQPFNITVWILGGGGFVDTSLIYFPSRNSLAVATTISIHASASFTISLAWIKGSVAIRLGLMAAYVKPAESSAAFSVTVFLEIEGRVSIISLIVVHLLLRLDMTYESVPNGRAQLIGTGTVCLEIRICALFSVSINKQYTQTLSGGSRVMLARNGDPYVAMATDYLTLLAPA